MGLIILQDLFFVQMDPKSIVGHRDLISSNDSLIGLQVLCMTLKLFLYKNVVSNELC